MNISTAEDLKKVQQPVRCLVIQLARLGDTLQSLMALKAAKQLYPQLEIHFLARERFASAARRVPWIEEVITLPTDDLLGPVVRGEAAERQALLGLAQWLSPLIEEPWDLLMNWSYSDASSYLTAMIPATVKLGYTRAKDQAFSCSDGWSHYMQAIVQGRVDQNIHLTDILTTQLLTALQIHVGDPVDAGDQPVIADFTADENWRARRRIFHSVLDEVAKNFLDQLEVHHRRRQMAASYTLVHWEWE